jgi:hypothetical protein
MASHYILKFNWPNPSLSFLVSLLYTYICCILVDFVNVYSVSPLELMKST